MKKKYLIIFLFFTLISVAQGNYTVTSLSDDGSLGTLRYGIQSTTASTIDFDSGLTGTLTLTSNLPSIGRNITITGNGINSLTMSGANSYNMFQVSGGVVLSISGITFTNNASSNGSIFRADNSNSSIIATSIKVIGNSRSYAFYTSNPSTITISNSTFTSNSGTLFGSDHGSTPSTTSDTETDYNNRITVTGSTFSSNTGTIFYTERYVKIDNCIFNNNTGQIGYFRGLNRYQVLNSTFTNNGSTLFYFYSELSNSGWGLSTLGTNHHLFSGNTFSGNTGTIISSGNSNDQAKTTITNNIFTNNGTNWSGSPAVISGNSLDNFITSVSHSSANSTITVVMNRPVFNTNAGSGVLEANDFQFVLSGGNATLGSSTPTSISVSGNTYTLGINTVGTIYGTEAITVNPVLNSIYDASTNIAGTSQKNNTTILKFLDDDLDGVANYQDQCPNTLSGVVVEPANGCDDVTAPSTPTGFNVSIGTYKLTLNWNQNTDDAIGYLIYGGTDQNALSLITTIGFKTTTSYSHLNLIGGTTYYYKIAAKDLAGNQSAFSTVISASPKTPLIWNGPKVTFEKISGSDWTLEENQDYLTENVILTRKNTQGLFNIAQESGYNYLSPTDTEWALGTTADFSQLNFSSWYNTIGGCPPCYTSTDFVVHLITDDVYVDVKILSWYAGSGGGFSYERSTANPAVLGDFNMLSKTLYDDSFTISPPSTDSTGAFTYISSDVNVATISGSTITIVGAGTTSITATQAADSIHLTNSISANLIVNAVSVVTKNGKLTTSNPTFVNKNGAIGSNNGVNSTGESKVTKSN